MLKTAKVWWVLLTQLGPIGRASREADRWVQRCMAEALQQDGLLQYLAEPRPYQQILEQFGYVDSAYTRAVFKALSTGQKNLLLKQDHGYRLNPAVPLPDSEQLARDASRSLYALSSHRDFCQRIPARMRQEPTGFVDRFEQEGPAAFSFDQALAGRIYSALRNVAFAFVDESELYGKRLLDLGCGSGRETAELWLRLKGNVHITAVDPVPGLLDMAGDNFARILEQERRAGLPPLDKTNRPSFHLMSAMDLDFPDEHFDAVFHSSVLHWLSDPEQGIREIARVLKPGGLVFGTQVTKPAASPYMDLMIRVHEGVYGFFGREQFVAWYTQAGAPISIATPAGAFCGRKVAQ